MNTGELRRLLDHPGPFATVHLDASRDRENADHEQELRWRAARRTLADDGADADTLAALDEVVRTAPPAVGRAGRLLVAAGGDVLLDRRLPDPPPTPVTRVGPLPYLLPLVERDPGVVPYVAALVDKTGADVRAVDANGVVRTEHTAEGSDHPVHKVRGGGWSHLRIQHNVEETVHRNVRQVAEELARLVDDVHARLLAVAGEEHVVAELREALPARCQAILAEPSGRRETGWHAGDFDRIITNLAADRARAEHDALVERFRAELATDDGLAVQGLAKATAALREHNAAAVVLGELPTTTVWTSTNPWTVALTEDELRAAGVEHTIAAQADEALPAAALHVGAELTSTDEPIADGIGVLLRHT